MKRVSQTQLKILSRRLRKIKILLNIHENRLKLLAKYRYRKRKILKQSSLSQMFTDFTKKLTRLLKKKSKKN